MAAAYVTTAMVQVEIAEQVLTLGASSKPTSTQVDTIILEEEAMVHAILAGRYTVPVTSTAGLALVTRIVRARVVERVMAAHYSGSVDRIPEQIKREVEQCDAMLDAIANGQAKLPGEGELESYGAGQSHIDGITGTEYQAKFKRGDEDDW